MSTTVGPARLEELRGDIGEHLLKIEDLFREPVKITIIIRNPAAPDGTRDVMLSNDESLDIAIAALRRVEQNGNHIPGSP